MQYSLLHELAEAALGAELGRKRPRTTDEPGLAADATTAEMLTSPAAMLSSPAARAAAERLAFLSDAAAMANEKDEEEGEIDEEELLPATATNPHKCRHCDARFTVRGSCTKHEQACYLRPLMAGVKNANVGRVVLVPRALWPTEPCDEEGGRGWTAIVLKSRWKIVTVRFLKTKAADEHLHLDVLQPIDPRVRHGSRSTKSVNDPRPAPKKPLAAKKPRS
jgi:hypothetical protein